MRLFRLAVFLFLSTFPLLSFGQECGIIYVTTTGVSSGAAGTKANPASLLYGLSLVSATDTIVWLANGTYNISNTLNIPNGASIEGTFDPFSWEKTNTNSSIIARDASNPDMVNLAIIALQGVGLSNFRLQDLIITVADAPSSQITLYGIHLTSCSSYNITRCQVSTGMGGIGIDGSLGANGLAGADGVIGVMGDDDAIISICGGNGGTGGGAGGGTTGTGGCTSGNTGSAGGTPTSQCSGGGGGGGGGGGQGNNDGGNGGTGGGWTGSNTSVGAGGNSSGWCNSTNDCNDQTSGSDGGNGANGTLGATGTAGSPGTNVGGYFIAGFAGGNGNCGIGGEGGAGGGAGAGEGNIFCDNGTGSTGGGGGGGGEGGSGGTGGTGGGGSFCIYLFSNGAGGRIQDCSLNPGVGGTGGAGGTGGTGGTGGVGGAGIPWFNSDLGCSGAGGIGGDGGQGGQGGDGASGSSLQIYEHPGGVLVSQLGISQVPGNPPVIAVINPGCAYSEVIFSATTSGTWNFGANANPSTASGSGPFSVTYATLGRKTIVFAGTIFTDYVHIFNTGISGTFISPQDTSVILGCPNSFSSTLSGTYYEWWFSGGTNTDTLADSTFQTIDSIFFNTPGVYSLILKVTTGDSCCGVAFDTTTVTVDTSSFSLSMTSSEDTICEGDTMTFIASGAYTSYEFFINDSSVQNSASNSYVTSTLNPGDSIVVIAFAGTCYTNPSDTLYPVVVPVPTANIVSSDTDNVICNGESVIFTASPSGYAFYDFQINSISVQSGTNNVFTTNNLNDGDSVSVLVPNLGCAGPLSNTIVMTVESTPVVTMFSSDPDTSICEGDTISFNVTPTGYPTYAFYLNSVFVQSGPSETFIASGINNGDVVYAAAASSNGCIGLTDSMLITVNPIPLVSISNSADTICLNDPISFVATPSGYDNYEFFVNGSSVQSNSNNTYTSSGIMNGDLVSVISTNADCPSLADTSTPITVISGPSITLSSSADTICPGNSLTFTALPAGYSSYDFYIGGISVQSGLANTFITSAINSNDTVTVFATDFVCAGPQSNAIIIIVDIPIATIAANDTICSGEIVTVTASPSGYSNYNFSLNGTSIQSGTSNIFTSNSIINGDKIEVTPTSNIGCVGPASNIIDFVVNPIPVVSLSSSPASICLGDNLTFTASPAGYDQYIFDVNKTIVQIDSSNTYSTTGILDGDSISVVAIDLGCVSMEAQIGPITVISGPTGILSSSDLNDTICNGDSITFSVNPSGFANYSFFLNSSSVQSDTLTTYTTGSLSDGDVVTIVISDSACPGPLSNSITTTVNPIPMASIISTNDSICDMEEITFSALPTGYNDYEFFVNGYSVQSGPLNTYETSSLNDMDVVSVIPADLGCIGTITDSITVTVYQLPYMSFSSDTVCLGDITSFNIDSVSTNISIWTWNYGDGNSSIGLAAINDYIDTGVYNVVVTATNINGCTDSSSNFAIVNPLPSADFSATPTTTSILNPIIDFNDMSLPPSPASILTWYWNFGDGTSDSIQHPTHTYLDTGKYQVQLSIINQHGCSDQTLQIIYVEPEFILYAPNSFTPNNDDINETFMPSGIGIENNFEMFIFDRWGDLVFESSDINNPWRGFANNGNKEAQEDVYVWMVFATDHSSKKHKFLGHVTLIR